jgi:hypothetical protein
MAFVMLHFPSYDITDSISTGNKFRFALGIKVSVKVTEIHLALPIRPRSLPNKDR